jgi:hypothetical protein
MLLSSTTLIYYAYLDSWFSKHGVADLVTMPTVCAVEGHVLEYHVGEIKAGCVGTLCAGKWHSAQAHMRLCAGQSVH